MSDQKTGYYVRYRVEGFGDRSAGPYPDMQEADNQARDINGFDGVRAFAITYLTNGEESFSHPWPLPSQLG